MFTAKSWEAESVRPALGTNNHYIGLVQLLDPPPLTHNRFSFWESPPVPEGQVWENVAISVPSPFSQAGQGCFVQLITAKRDVYRNNTLPGYWPHFYYYRTNALDKDYPYPFTSGAWNLPGAGRFVDSPVQSLFGPSDGGGADWYRSTADDSFKTYLMFRPPSVPGFQTTWIPVAWYTWAWQGTAEKLSGAWSLTQGSGGVTQAPFDNFIHPTWTQYSPSPFTLIGGP